MKTPKCLLLEINTAKALEHHAKMTGQSMSQIANMAIDYWLGDHQ